MTKGELFEELKDLDDDAEIHVFCTSMETCGVYAHDIYIDDKVTGKDVQNEATIVAHF